MTDFPTCPGGHGKMRLVDQSGEFDIPDVPRDAEVGSMESPVKCPDCGYVEDSG